MRTQVSLTEHQLRRLQREAHRRHLSVSAVIRDALDRLLPDEDAQRTGRIDALLAVAGSAASGTGTVARDHDDLLGEVLELRDAHERWYREPFLEALPPEPLPP